MVFKIDPSMTYTDAVRYYEKYLAVTKAEGKKPVTFLRFLTGRYQQ